MEETASPGRRYLKARIQTASRTARWRPHESTEVRGPSGNFDVEGKEGWARWGREREAGDPMAGEYMWSGSFDRGEEHSRAQQTASTQVAMQ